ncbi:MAG: signal peptidase I [Desulfovibrionaceae bacterium]|nr:signal peptidase I [Desulfovibrionaceae bacterium]
MKKRHPDQRKSLFREYGEALAIALVLAFFIRTFLFQAFTIPSGSMLETVQIGDYLLVNKFSYGVKNPLTGAYLIERDGPRIGDIIVFEFPGDPSIDYIKRVEGLPGDVIEVRDKELYRNGELVREDYVQHIHPTIMSRLDNIGPVTVPDGEYFVMGDNRDNSEDSRAWGTVRRSAIHGKAWRIYWSWDSKAMRPRLNRLGHKVE